MEKKQWILRLLTMTVVETGLNLLPSFHAQATLSSLFTCKGVSENLMGYPCVLTYLEKFVGEGFGNLCFLCVATASKRPLQL